MASLDADVSPPRSVPVSLLILAGPLIGSMVSRTLMSLVDFLMVSRLGVEAQAAVLPATLVIFCLFGFGIGAMMAVTTFVSQSFGRGANHACGSYAWQGLYLSLLFGVAVLPLYFLAEPFFKLVGHAPRVAELETIYTQVRILGMVPAVASCPLSNFFTGIHRPAIGFFAATVANIFNVVANYALIYGHFGFPAMGVAGAAWATNIAFCLQCAILLVWMIRPQVDREFQTRKTWRIHAARMMSLVRVGAPIGFHLIAEIATWTLFTLVALGRFGATQLAASNICLKLLEISYMPAVGISEALSSAMGKAIGQQRIDLAERFVTWAVRINVAYMGLIGVLFAIMPGPLLRPFTDDPQIAAIARTVLLFCASFQVFDALQMTYASALRGAGDTRWPAIAVGSCAILLLAGGGAAIIAIRPQWQCYGPWGVATIYTMILATLLWSRYRFGPWRKIRLAD